MDEVAFKGFVKMPPPEETMKYAIVLLRPLIRANRGRDFHHVSGLGPSWRSASQISDSACRDFKPPLTLLMAIICVAIFSSLFDATYALG